MSRLPNLLPGARPIDSRWRELGIFATILLGAALFLGWLHWPRVVRFGADASTPKAALWILTPHVTPGGTVAARVRVDGSHGIAITSVTVAGAGDAQRAYGAAGPTWGDRIVSRPLTSRASDTLDLSIQVPRDASPGQTLDLVVDVSYVEVRALGATFSNAAQVEHLRTSIRVRSPTMAAVRRALSLGIALGLLVLVCVGLRAMLGWLGEDRVDAIGLGWAFLVVMHLWVGYTHFGGCLIAAAGAPSAAFRLLAMAVWLLVPFWRVRRHRRDAPPSVVIEPISTTPPPVVSPPVDGPYRSPVAPKQSGRHGRAVGLTVATLVDALWSGGLAAKRRRTCVVVRDPIDPGGRATAIVELGVANVLVRTHSTRLALAIAKAVAQRIGVVRCHLAPSVRLDVVGHADVAQLELEAFRRRFSDDVRRT